MPEDVLIGLIWGAIGTLLLQVATLLIYRLGGRRARAAVTTQGAATDLAAPGRNVEGELQAAQIDRLQQRIAVLERITTDKGYQTARAIDELL